MEVVLGKLIEGEARRDAIHIAVAPVVAGQTLEPGNRIGLVNDKAYFFEEDEEGALGIVDPFLSQPVRPGERFWLFLYPNTITSLRHVWTHPAFKAKPPGE